MADPLDVLSLAEGKSAINLKATNSEQDTVLARHITAISRLIDDRCGPVVQRTVTAELYEGGGSEIMLKRWPVVSITLVREATGSTITTIPAVAFGGSGTGYTANLTEGRLSRTSGGWPCGSQTVEVTYVAGRYATTATVDARFKDAAGAILRRLWKREAGTWAQSSSIFEGEDSTFGTGFFRVAAPIINEMLGADQQMGNLIGQG